MNKEQALTKDLQTKQYIQNNKLRALFSQLTKEVLFKRPENPIQFLIDYISKRNKRSIICLQGFEEEKRTKLATGISNKFNFHLINLPLVLGDKNFYSRSNAEISQKVIEEINKVDKVYRGIVISGFPNNAAQADAIQKAGIIPDRYFLLYNDQPAVRDAYNIKYSQEEANLLMDRNELQLKELKELLGDQIDMLPLATDKAVEKLNSSISIRLKKITPLEAPRIVIMYPPFIIPKALEAFVQKYSFHWVSVESAFKKASKKEQFVKYVGSHIRQHKSLSKEVELALIQTQSKSSAARNKGLLISGWPQKKRSIPFLKLPFINPHLIFIFTATREKAIDEFQKLEEKSDIFTICQKPTLEIFKTELKEYEQVVQSLKGQPNCQLMPVNQNENQVFKTFESLIDNPKIYS